ncbi:hypothetical protein SAMN06298216_3680 [Spirosomataceae bacterium TFI 002]|nr:hypothetical protein SAMN06298216_3680 [Spirosomataceae bacterium TFI 002]
MYKERGDLTVSSFFMAYSVHSSRYSVVLTIFIQFMSDLFKMLLNDQDASKLISIVVFIGFVNNVYLM